MNVRLREIGLTYPNGVRALAGVSLDIPPGMFGLLGPNGAGKSSLMRILATLQDPDGGSAHLGDLDILRQKSEVRKHLGYLPQDFGVYEDARAESLLDHFAVLEGIRGRSARAAACEALLRKTNLWDVRKQKLGGYSGGMKQRFGVALALLGDPRLLIVDEPTAGLDPEERVRFLNLLSELGETGVVILSTHIVADVSELCTRMAIIESGEILLEAVPLKSVEALEGRIWQRVIERADLPTVERSHDVLSTKLLAGRTVVRAFASQRPGSEFEPAAPDLEDVYFSVIRGHVDPRSLEEIVEGSGRTRSGRTRAGERAREWSSA